jgi:hypothetical protein
MYPAETTTRNSTMPPRPSPNHLSATSRRILRPSLSLPQSLERTLDINRDQLPITPPTPRNLNERPVQRRLIPPRLNDPSLGVGGRAGEVPVEK